MKVTVDEAKCYGSGRCALIAPEVFAQREDDGIVSLLDSNPAEDRHAAVHEAATVCPATAIHVED